MYNNIKDDLPQVMRGCVNARYVEQNNVKVKMVCTGELNGDQERSKIRVIRRMT